MNEPTTQVLMTIDNDTAAALQVAHAVDVWARGPAPLIALADTLHEWLSTVAERALGQVRPGTLGQLVAVTAYAQGMAQVDWHQLARHYAMELGGMDDDALARRAELALWTAAPERPVAP